MRLKSLEISRETWKDGQPLLGKIRFENTFGELAVVLDEEQCKRMVAIVADALVAQAKATANILAADVIDAETKLIEQAA